MVVMPMCGVIWTQGELGIALEKRSFIVLILNCLVPLVVDKVAEGLASAPMPFSEMHTSKVAFQTYTRLPRVRVFFRTSKCVLRYTRYVFVGGTALDYRS